MHIVCFHISEDFANAKTEVRKAFYSLMGFPSNVYDGGYAQTYFIDESKIDDSGMRQVHAIGMSLSKSIQGSTLQFSGSVVNSESDSFNGFVLVFIVENGLVDSQYGITWNFVFRDYGLNKTLDLSGFSQDDFSGSWNIPSNVKPENIQVIASVYDTNSREPTHGWPYSVQSVCDVCAHSGMTQTFLPTDLNKDGEVNIQDMTIVAIAFDSKPGDQNWNPTADLDKDNWVTIVDITMIALDFGKIA
jgi:hypothetical protein